MVDLPHALIGEFIDAVVQDPQKAAALLSEHPDLINARWIHDETVLHFLAVEGFAEGVRFLAARGADIDAVNEFGDSALVDVAGLGIYEIAEILLGHGANPNASSPTRDNALHCAVRSCNARLVTLLLNAGANPQYVTYLGESVFDALDESGADPTEREAILAVLADYGVRPDEADGES
jgi:ankyrin repeat protein